MKQQIVILGNTGKNAINAYSWFCKTVSQGMKLNDCSIISIDYKTHTIDQIREKLFSKKDYILFTHLTFHKFHNKFKILEIFDDLRRLNNVKIIHTLCDAREEPRYDGDISYSFDMALVSQYENIDKFKNYWKIPVHYWPYSSLTYKRLGNKDNELKFMSPVFTGTPFSHPDRSQFLNRLQQVMNLTIFRTQSGNDKRHLTRQLSVSTPAILGLSTGYDKKIEGYICVRPWQYLGTGACMITRPHKTQDNIIPNDLYYTIPDYSTDSVYLVQKYWNEIIKTDTTKMRKKAFKFIQKYHSSQVRMKQTLELINEKRNKLDIFLDEI